MLRTCDLVRRPPLSQSCLLSDAFGLLRAVMRVLNQSNLAFRSLRPSIPHTSPTTYFFVVGTQMKDPLGLKRSATEERSTFAVENSATP